MRNVFPNSAHPLFTLGACGSKLLVSWAGMPNGRLCGRCAVLRRFVLQQPPETCQPQQQQQEQQHGEPEGRSAVFTVP